MRAAATAAVLVAGVVVATGFVPDSAATVPAAMQGAGAAPVAAAEPDVCGTARGASTAAGLTAEQTLVARAGVASAERNGVGKDGAVVVIAVLDSGELLFERQFRYPLQRAFLELPAGKIDPGEDIRNTASRELLEETGYSAQ